MYPLFFATKETGEKLKANVPIASLGKKKRFGG
jgi:hypothetical protein